MRTSDFDLWKTIAKKKECITEMSILIKLLTFLSSMQRNPLKYFKSLYCFWLYLIIHFKKLQYKELHWNQWGYWLNILRSELLKNQVVHFIFLQGRVRLGTFLWTTVYELTVTKYEIVLLHLVYWFRDERKYSMSNCHGKWLLLFCWYPHISHIFLFQYHTMYSVCNNFWVFLFFSVGYNFSCDWNHCTSRSEITTAGCNHPSCWVIMWSATRGVPGTTDLQSVTHPDVCRVWLSD